MKRKSVLALVLVVALFTTLVGCTYVGRPTGIGNHTGDYSSNLDNLLKRPEPVVPDVPVSGEPPIDETPTEPPVDQPSVVPPVEKPGTPFAASGDVFAKISEILQNIKEQNKVSDSATGVSAELMKGRTVRVYMPTDVTGKDNEMVKAISNTFGMSVVVNNLECTGAEYTKKIYRSQMAGEKADLMYVDQEIWGDIHYFTQPIDNFINFDLGDQLDTFRSSFMNSYILSDENSRSNETFRDFYVAAGIGAPYLLAYNRANLVTTGTAIGPIDTSGKPTQVELKDPVALFNDKKWNLGTFTQILKLSTVGNCVGLATVTESDYNADIWFGSDAVLGMKVDTKSGSYSAVYPTVNDIATIGGMVNDTLDVYQSLYWTTKGANGNYIGDLVPANDRANTFKKLFNSYVGSDSVTSYAMVGIDASELATVAAAAGNADWDFVGYPFGKTFESQMKDFVLLTDEKTGKQEYYDINEEYKITFPVAGWSSGFAVLKNCENPSVALRFAEEYTKIWRDDYQGAFMKTLSDEQQARYMQLKSQVFTSFYRSIKCRLSQVTKLYPGIGIKLPSDTVDYYDSMSTFFTDPSIMTHLMYHKNDPLGAYSPSDHMTWGSFFKALDANSYSHWLLASYEPMRVLFYND